MGDILELIEANDLNVESEDFRDLCRRYGTDSLYNDICVRVQQRRGSMP